MAKIDKLWEIAKHVEGSCLCGAGIWVAEVGFFFFFDINLIELFDFLNYVNALFWLKMELKYVCDFGILFTIIPMVVLL